MPTFLLGGDVYRVIDKRVKRGGSDDHENVGDDGDHEVWEEEDVGNDDHGQSYTLYC